MTPEVEAALVKAAGSPAMRAWVTALARQDAEAAAFYHAEHETGAHDDNARPECCDDCAAAR